MKRAISHPSRLLNRKLAARKLSANRLSLDIQYGVALVEREKGSENSAKPA